jgi:hypothetical protein
MKNLIEIEKQYCKVYQNGTLLFEGTMDITECEEIYLIYFHADNGEKYNVGIVSKFGCAIMRNIIK